MLSRRSMLLGAAALPVGARALALQEGASFTLRTIPTRIYRSTFNSREAMDGWVFFLVLEASMATPVTPVSLRIDHLAGEQIVRVANMSGPALAAVARQDISPTRLTGEAPNPAVYWPQVFRLHFYVPNTPRIDALSLDLRVADAAGTEHRILERVPIVDFQQRTSLIFPFHGNGIISQAGVLGGGHRNRSGQFALDALGLDANHAPVRRPGTDRPQDYSGWGRPIIAPGAGIVVGARNDRPDQPKDGVSDPAFHAPEYPDGGDVGNHVVIDHGNEEFSLLAHLREGSVLVAIGDRLTQGQPVGELGNSGDTSGPHLHDQLQDGPRGEYADGLPVTFANVTNLARGSYFTAR